MRLVHQLQSHRTGQVISFSQHKCSFLFDAQPTRLKVRWTERERKSEREKQTCGSNVCSILFDVLLSLSSISRAYTSIHCYLSKHTKISNNPNVEMHLQFLRFLHQFGLCFLCCSNFSFKTFEFFVCAVVDLLMILLSFSIPHTALFASLFVHVFLSSVVVFRFSCYSIKIFN